jgi:hypothetical protein
MLTRLCKTHSLEVGSYYCDKNIDWGADNATTSSLQFMTAQAQTKPTRSTSQESAVETKESICLCHSVLGFQCPANAHVEIFFGRIFGFVPSVRRNSPEMIHPTAVLTNPTDIFRANFRANFGHMERASLRRYSLVHNRSIYYKYCRTVYWECLLVFAMTWQGERAGARNEDFDFFFSLCGGLHKNRPMRVRSPLIDYGRARKHLFELQYICT